MIGETMANENCDVVFQRQTRDTIVKCADYLRENAEKLAERFADGCQEWKISLEYYGPNDQEMFTGGVIVRTSNRNVNILYYAD